MQQLRLEERDITHMVASSLLLSFTGLHTGFPRQWFHENVLDTSTLLPILSQASQPASQALVIEVQLLWY